MAVDPRLLDYARQMRHQPTPAEELLWRELRNRKLGGFKFRRQHPHGRYIADFFSPEAAIVIELDGDSHTAPGADEYDETRLHYLNELNLEVLRFWNSDVHDNLDGVLEVILKKCIERSAGNCVTPPHPP